MFTPTLVTKLYIPPGRQDILPRPRLNGLISKGLSKKLTLVTAPAGFGKTTFLGDCTRLWKRQTAWLTLDSGDNDKNRFLAYFVAALNSITGEFEQRIQGILQASQHSDIESLLCGLINEILDFQKPFVLVLDDYHLITNPEIHEILIFFVENQPPDMHLVVSSRSDPPWPLARWRVRQEMVEIRSHDLRFRLDESASLINQVLKLDLSDDDINRLDTRVEGWVSGLLLAALSIQGRENISGFIQTFEGSNRYIFDYLVEEVLNQLSSEFQEFLLKTSILDRLCAPLCDSLLVRGDSQTFLRQAEQLNLFLFPLDDQRYWYRYHRLFSDLLVSRLGELFPQEVDDLHRRASSWYENNGYLSEAVAQAFAADDVKRVAQLAERNVLGLMESGELGILVQWINRLPQEMVEGYPWLKIAQAWALAQSGSFDEAISWLPLAAESPDGVLRESEEYSRHISGHIAAIRVYIEILSLGDYQQTVHFAQKALADLPETDRRTRGMVMVNLGTLQRVHQDFPAALSTLNAALTIYRDSDQSNVVVDILSQIARVRREQGQLRETVRLCQEALKISDRLSKKGGHRLPGAAYTMGILGRVYYEWDQLDQALEIGLQALALSERWGQANILLGNHLLLTKVFMAKGRFQDALGSIQAARRAGESLSETHEFVLQTHETMVRLRMGDLDAAERWVKYESVNLDTSQNERIWELAPLILILYREKRIKSLDDLSTGLDKMLEQFQMKGVWRHILKIHILKGMIFQALGDDHRGFNSLIKALSLGEPEGYIRSFIDHGIHLEKLLRRAAADPAMAVYSTQLLEVLKINTVEDTRQPRRKPFPFVETLTDREKEVLLLLSTNLTIPEIADALDVTIGTLRTHIKRIYTKLDVHSRFEATTRAKEAGLLQS